MFKSLIEKYNDVKARREDGEGGFTLIELLVVVVIIGILVAIAIPLYLNYQKSADEKSVKADIRNAVSAVAQCYSDNNNTLPADKTFSASGVFTATGCANDTVTVSSDSTASLAFHNVTGGYTITGTGTDSSIHFTYTSSTGNIA